VIVDPKDENRAFVAVLGHPYGANAERGVFRTVNGGKVWEKVLYKDENTGAMALAFDPATRARLRPVRAAHDGVNRLRVARIERQGHRAGVLVLVQHLLPDLAAVDRAEHAPLGVRPVRVAEHGDEGPVLVLRVDDHGGDLLAVAEAGIGPGLAAVVVLYRPSPVERSGRCNPSPEPT